MTALGWSAVSFALSFIGGLCALRMRGHMQWLTAFSSGVLIAVAMVSLLPEAFALEHAAAGVTETHRSLLFVSGLGLLMFYLLDLVVPEHHARGHEHHRHAPETPRVVGLIGAGAFSVHRFFEGVLLAATATAPSGVLQAVGAALVFHNFADGLSSASIMLRDGQGPRRTLLANGLVSACPMAGLLAGKVVTVPIPGVGYGLALFAGAFLYLGGSHLLIREHGSGLRYAPFAAAAGFLLVYFFR